MCYKQKCKVVSLNLAHPVGLSSFVQPWLPPKFDKSREIPTKFDLTAVHGRTDRQTDTLRSLLHALAQRRAGNKKAQLSLTNPRDAIVCQKLLQFDVLTTLSPTILAYSFSCYCVRNLRNPAKFTKNSNLWSSRSSKVIDLGGNGKPICDFISATVFEIFTVKDRKLLILHTPVLYDALQRRNAMRYRRNLYTAGKCI